MKNRVCPGAICKSNPHYSVSVTLACSRSAGGTIGSGYIFC